MVSEPKLRMLSKLVEQEMTYTQLKNEFQFSETAFLNHLKELAQAGLITKSKEGRYVLTEKGRHLLDLESAKKGLQEGWKDFDAELRRIIRTQQGKWVWFPIKTHTLLKAEASKLGTQIWKLADAAVRNSLARHRDELNALLLTDAIDAHQQGPSVRNFDTVKVGPPDLKFVGAFKETAEHLKKADKK